MSEKRHDICANNTNGFEDRKSLLETATGAGTKPMKEEDIVGESDSVAYSTPREEGRTAMSRLVNTVDFLCFVYNVCFRTLVEEHKICDEKDLNRKVDLSLAESPYNVRRSRQNDHTEYHVLESSYMKDMTKVHGDVMKLAAEGHMSCFAVQFALWYKALALIEKTMTVSGNIVAWASLRMRIVRVRSYGQCLAERTVLCIIILWLETINKQQSRSLQCI